MKNLIPTLLILSFLFSGKLYTQDLTCKLAGHPEWFNIDLSRVNISFKNSLTPNEMSELIASETALAVLRDNSNASSNQALFDTKGIKSKEEIYNLLARLNKHPEIEYASLVLKYKDGITQCITDQIVIRLKDNADRSSISSACQEFGGTIFSTASFFRSSNRVRENFMEAVLVVKLPKEQVVNSFEIANKLSAITHVDYAEPNFIRYINQYTNDPDYSLLWAHSKINVPGAWAVTPGGSSSITIAVIDDGVELNHPDLLGNVISGYDATYSSGPAGQLLFNSFGAPTGNDSHGTACAGIIGAIANNGKGGVGIAYNCKILPVRVARNVNSQWITDDLILADGINQACLQGADVLSNSWGGGSPASIVENAILYASTNGRASLGAPVFFASGNSNWNVSWPAQYFKSIAVGATTSCDSRKRSGTSSEMNSCQSTNTFPDPLGVSCDGDPCWGGNYGIFLDISAPGTGIATTDLSGTAGYEQGDYTYTFNGTSAACPHAAGVMALILSINPSLTYDQARVAIESTCDKIGGYNYYSNPSQSSNTWSTQAGYGRINAQAAVSYAQSLLPPPAGTPLTASLTAQSTLCWGPGSFPKLTVTITGGTPHINTNGPNHYLCQFYDDANYLIPSNSSMTNAFFSAEVNTPTSINIDFPAGAPTFPLANKTYYLDVWGSDYVHHHIATITITINRSPTVSIAGDLYRCKGTNAALGNGTTVSGGTPPYTYQWTPVSADLINHTGINCTAANRQFTETFTLTAVDNLGCSASGNRTVFVSQVTANAGPDKNICLNSISQTIGLQATGGVPTFSTYTYAWSPAAGLNNTTVYNPTVTLSAPGIHTYNVTATDGIGCFDVDQVTVTVLSYTDPIAFAGTDISGVCAGSSVQLNGSISGGSGPFSYSWLQGSLTIASTPSTTVSPSSPTTYTFSVKDANGCIGQDQVTILNIFPVPVISSVYASGTSSSSGTQYRCANSPGIQLNVGSYGGTQPYSFVWSPTSGLNNSVISNPIATPSTGTIYNVTLTDANGCIAISKAPKIAVFTAPPDVDFYFNKNCCPMLEWVNITNVNASLGDSYVFNHPAGVTVNVPYSATANWNNGPGVIPEFGWNPVYFGHPYFPVGYRDISLTVKIFDSFNNECYSVTKTKSAYVLPSSGGSSSCSVLPSIAQGSTASACGIYTGFSIYNDKMAVTVNNSCPTIISPGARATYIGGSGGVTLNPGFEAVPGSMFWAFIEQGPCMPKN